MRMRAIFAGTLLAAVLSAGALAADVMFKADLKGSAEVPPTDSKGTGAAELIYDPASKTLNWKITYSGLTGPATMAHIHGPAGPGKNGPVAVKFGDPKSPINGSTTLTSDQAADLEAGNFYINIHTAEHKGGEIRGQVMPAK
ncbi:MAG: CHRD domain-containing protein [Rhodomicrobium sp.]